MKLLEILIVEDDSLEARLLEANLSRHARVNVCHAASGEEALERLARQHVDVVLTDMVMPGMGGIELVRRIRETDPSLPVIVMTAYATLPDAVRGIRMGATDFLQKPVNMDALAALMERAVKERPVREQITALLGRRQDKTADGLIVGDHPLLDGVRSFANRVARLPTARVLITGESGTGKSLLARAIHELSDATGRFVVVNCAALPGTLLESELFGHEKGAFTDARHLKRGLIEMAHGGTLLLDEIGAMPIELQAKLLLFLESNEIRRLGGNQPIRVSTQVIAATNENLATRARERTFRVDLLYRLDVASVEMPPLRDMPAVIPKLAERYTADIATGFHRPLPELTPESFRGLKGYDWPGNARELRNAVERAFIAYESGPFLVKPPTSVPPVMDARSGVHLPYGLTLDEVERLYLTATLGRHAPHGELAEVADRLGISRKTLWDKRKRYQLES